ncbi:carbohydrate porin, partial [Vibrio sp. V29_P1S30P107]
MKKISVIAAAVAASLAAGSAFAVDFNGYFRAGTGISGNGEADVSFMKNGIGRLGNENDNYYEFGFSEELKTGDQTWKVDSMIAQGNDGANGWEDGDFNVAQFNVQAKGLIASDPGA